MNSVSNLCALVILVFFGYLFLNLGYESPQTQMPHIQSLPSDELLAENKRIAELFSISVALEKYKSEHNTYPISKKNGREWNTYSQKNGAENSFWIPDLSPKYISVLPRDPRKNLNYFEQYGYKSDGANYKLIAGYPEDCEAVKSSYEKLIPSPTECNGYGFWSSQKAAYW